MRIKYVLLVLALLLLALIAGCANKQEAASNVTTATTQTAKPAMEMKGMEGATVNVDLTEWAITLKPATVKAGMIHFMVKNSGTATHSFAIRGNGVDEKLKSNLSSGETDMLMVTLKAGTYETYCPVGKHESKGMKAEFKVE